MSMGDEECRKRRIMITEICNVPDLDEGKTMEIKMLVNDQHYWLKKVKSDCLEGYGNMRLVRCFLLFIGRLLPEH